MNALDLVRTEFVPGVFPDMPAEQYFRSPAISASSAKKMLRSPAHYRLAVDTPSEPSDAMRFGSVVHCGVLEPDSFDSRCCCAPKVDKRSNAGKSAWEAFCAESAGKLVLSSDDFDRARRCIDAVRAHPAATALLTGAQCELSLFWHDARYKVPSKARFDAFNLGGVIDLKTTVDASPDGFARQIATFQYDLQAAFYLSGGEHALNETPRFFVFIAVESEPPHAVACYQLGSASILAGMHRMNIALERYAEALKAGEWNGYSKTIDTIETPKWARRFDA